MTEKNAQYLELLSLITGTISAIKLNIAVTERTLDYVVRKGDDSFVGIETLRSDLDALQGFVVKLAGNDLLK